MLTLNPAYAIQKGDEFLGKLYMTIPRVYLFFTLRISFINQGCSFKSCFNGGSCFSDKEKKTFSCSCPLPWTGHRYELKLGNDYMTVIKLVFTSGIRLLCVSFKI